MSKIIKRTLTVFSVFFILMISSFYTANAANPCRVSFSDPSCTVGSNVTVSVSVAGSVAAADINLVYNTDLLEFVSVSGGFSSGGNGAVRLYNMYNSGSGNMSFSITFRARAAGTASITVASYDIVDGNADPMDVTVGSSTITIANLSGDSSLSSLTISPGALSPAFSPSTTNYSVSVSNSVTSITVSAIPANSQARASVSGGSSLSVGRNTITVTVTAGNGTTTNYYITVTRAAAAGGSVTPPNTGTSSETSSSEEATIHYAEFADGTRLEVGGFTDDQVPRGFEIISFNYDGEEILAISHDGQEGVALYLLGDETHPSGFYFYDQEDNTVYPMTTFSSSSGYIIVNFPSDFEIPEGYSAATVTINDSSVNVFAPDGTENPTHYLLCAINSEGVKNVYLYDISENTLQRYGFAFGEDGLPVFNSSEDENTSSSEEPADDTENEAEPILPALALSFLPDALSDVGLLQHIIIAFLLLILVMIVIIIVFGIKNRRLKNDFSMFIIGEHDDSGETDPVPEDFMSPGEINLSASAELNGSDENISTGNFYTEYHEALTSDDVSEVSNTAKAQETTDDDTSGNSGSPNVDDKK